MIHLKHKPNQVQGFEIEYKEPVTFYYRITRIRIIYAFKLSNLRAKHQ